MFVQLISVCRLIVWVVATPPEQTKGHVPKSFFSCKAWVMLLHYPHVEQIPTTLGAPNVQPEKLRRTRTSPLGQQSATDDDAQITVHISGTVSVTVPVLPNHDAPMPR